MDFSNIKVMEIGSDPAVAFCGLQFALWGAEVIVSEAHALPLRRLAPLVDDVSLTWTFLSANKRMASGDLALIAADAHVIVTDLESGELVKFGIVPGKDTVVQRVRPFGRGGYFDGMPGLPLVYEAASGYLAINGLRDREPLRAPGNMIAYLAGAGAFGATLAAVYKHLKTGFAETIETSQLDVLTAITPFVRSQYVGKADARQGGPGTGVRIFPVGDGYISANLFGKRTFSLVLEQLGIPEEEVPEHLDSPEKRYDLAALRRFLRQQAPDGSAEQLFNNMLSRGLPPIGLYLEPRQLPNNEHIQAIDYMLTLEHERLGRLHYPGLPARLDRFSPAVGPSGPLENRPEKPARAVGGKVKGANTRPLEGVRIIDFTQAWVGPFASMILADLGAEVIKIESHKRVDVWRNWAGNIPPDQVVNDNAHPFNVSGNFNSTNRNKREIAIDLSREEGVTIAKQLIATADIVMDNYTPRVMAKFGLDYDSLKRVKSDIIVVAWSGYGKEGPYADYRANGTTIESMAGWDALFGYRDGEPQVMGFYQADAITGFQMAACTLVALIHRDLTGEGQMVNGSMIEAAIPYIGEEVLNASLGGKHIVWGNRHPDMCPHGVFPCNEDDTWIALACRHDDDWARLAEVIGIDSHEFDTFAARRQKEDEVEAIISSWTRELSRQDAAGYLQAGGVPAAAVIDVLEALAHPEFTRRQWFQKQFHADMGLKLYGGFPWQFSRARLSADYPPPRLGEHTEEILKDLGYDRDTIARLFAQQTVGCILSKPTAED